ncbi:hypothetical protein ACFS5M_01370 [Lacinutrix iliipiscaria]|uniref:Uncharacterized protein n=1 Tax=Lacinutrix iliipiscaria TaxID=1230532 RepID=A0ABW5WHT5_9FLAO
MKYVIWIVFIASISSVLVGYFLDIKYSEQFIGSGVVGLFIIVFPLFIYYRWKDRNLKDYMLTQENLDKMRDFKKNEK